MANTRNSQKKENNEKIREIFALLQAQRETLLDMRNIMSDMNKRMDNMNKMTKRMDNFNNQNDNNNNNNQNDNNNNNNQKGNTNHPSVNDQKKENDAAPAEVVAQPTAAGPPAVAEAKDSGSNEPTISVVTPVLHMKAIKIVEDKSRSIRLQDDPTVSTSEKAECIGLDLTGSVTYIRTEYVKVQGGTAYEIPGDDIPPDKANALKLKVKIPPDKANAFKLTPGNYRQIQRQKKLNNWQRKRH